MGCGWHLLMALVDQLDMKRWEELRRRIQCQGWLGMVTPLYEGRCPGKKGTVEQCAGPELQTYQDAVKFGWGDVWEADGNTTLC